MALTIWQVDAFTSTPLRGNPAAVCILPAEREDAWLQDIAREMNLSETAFLICRGGDYHLRWFTPSVEVDLCGHATLASAHVLWEEGLLSKQQVARFQTRSGLLTAECTADGIELDFPIKGSEPLDDAPDLGSALGATVVDLQRNVFDYLACLESEDAVRQLKPDFTALGKLPVRGIIVTSQASTDGQGSYDFVSRFFAPASGVDEDPVTGSAHCFLAPYWAAKLAKDKLIGYQCSARGGMVSMRLLGERVKLGGQAVTVLRGELLV